MNEHLAERLVEIASMIMSSENVKDQCAAVDSISNLLKEQGFLALAAAVAAETVEWMESAGLDEEYEELA